MSHSVVMQLMRATRTRVGLTVKARLVKRQYPTKVKVTTEEMVSVNLEPEAFHGERNYTLSRLSHQNMKN